jgi:hypothetical protein
MANMNINIKKDETKRIEDLIKNEEERRSICGCLPSEMNYLSKRRVGHSSMQQHTIASEEKKKSLKTRICLF